MLHQNQTIPTLSVFLRRTEEHGTTMLLFIFVFFRVITGYSVPNYVESSYVPAGYKNDNATPIQPEGTEIFMMNLKTRKNTEPNEA